MQGRVFMGGGEEKQRCLEVAWVGRAACSYKKLGRPRSVYLLRGEDQSHSEISGHTRVHSHNKPRPCSAEMFKSDRVLQVLLPVPGLQNTIGDLWLLADAQPGAQSPGSVIWMNPLYKNILRTLKLSSRASWGSQASTWETLEFCFLRARCVPTSVWRLWEAAQWVEAVNMCMSRAAARVRPRMYAGPVSCSLLRGPAAPAISGLHMREWKAGLHSHHHSGSENVQRNQNQSQSSSMQGEEGDTRSSVFIKMLKEKQKQHSKQGCLKPDDLKKKQVERSIHAARSFPLTRPLEIGSLLLD